jgi:hypothetical protein
MFNFKDSLRKVAGLSKKGSRESTSHGASPSPDKREGTSPSRCDRHRAGVAEDASAFGRGKGLDTEELDSPIGSPLAGRNSQDRAECPPVEKIRLKRGAIPKKSKSSVSAS